MVKAAATGRSGAKERKIFVIGGTVPAVVPRRLKQGRTE
jgi:hypothetical protein